MTQRISRGYNCLICVESCEISEIPVIGFKVNSRVTGNMPYICLSLNHEEHQVLLI
jgi:hypothetical protein